MAKRFFAQYSIIDEIWCRSGNETIKKEAEEENHLTQTQKESKMRRGGDKWVFNCAKFTKQFFKP
jgi:hypothetical protein